MKLYLFFSMIILTLFNSCNLKTNIEGTWLCVSGDYYKSGKFNFLHDGELVIDFIGKEGRSQTVYQSSPRTYGVAERGGYSTRNYSVDAPKQSNSKFRIEGEYIFIDFSKNGKEIKFLIQRIDEYHIVLKEEDGNFIELKK